MRKRKQLVCKAIDDELHQKFKVLCAQKRITMTDVFNLCVRRVVESKGNIVDEWKKEDEKKRK